MWRHAALALCVVACNQVYGLDETTIRPTEAALPPPDMDADGILDKDDKCPGVFDPKQDDGDRDGFGDLCDACPNVNTKFNHDEDGDTFGDACDICPNIADFQIDSVDDDKVGDPCEPDATTKNQLLLFDPFVELGPEWEQTGTWSIIDDAVTGALGSTLATTTVTVDGARPFTLALGITATHQLASSMDNFRLDVVDATGPVLGCAFRCVGAICQLLVTPVDQGATINPVLPLSTMYLRRTNVDVCEFADLGTMSGLPPPVFNNVRIRITGSPAVRFRYLAVWQ